MSTINGCGTLRYDWSHFPDGTARATIWFVIAFFPVVPLKRECLRVITRGEKRSFFSLRGGPAWHAEYEVHGRVPMEALGIVKTYVKAYLLLPVVLLVPAIAILVTPFLLLSHLNLNRDTARELQVTAVATATAGILVYWGIVASSILDRARGLKK